MTGNRLWTLGSVVLIVAIVAMGWLLAISPMLTQADAARLQAQTIDAQNASQQVSTTKLAASFAKLPELEATLATLQKAIPEDADLDTFLDGMQKTADATGVVVNSYTAAEAVAYGGGSITAAPAQPAGASPSPSPSPSPDSGSTGSVAPAVPADPAGALAGKLFTVPVTLGLKGSPEQVMAFTRAMQESSRFFLVTDVSFAGGSGATGTVAGSLFVLRASAAPGATTGAAAPDTTSVASK